MVMFGSEMTYDSQRINMIVQKWDQASQARPVFMRRPHGTSSGSFLGVLPCRSGSGVEEEERVEIDSLVEALCEFARESIACCEHRAICVG
jgi:vacuolar-type H+-ATPase subunit E/Vma4